MKNRASCLYCALIPIIFFVGLIVPAVSDESPKASFRQAITAVAFDPQNGQFTNISAEEIQVSGFSATAVRCERLSGPRRMLLLVDLGPNSWINQVRRQNLSEAVREFVAQCEPADSLALHVFGKIHQVLVPFCRDPSRILNEFRSASAKKDMELLKEYGRFSDVIKGLRASLVESRADLRFGDAIVLISPGAFVEPNGRELQKIQAELIGLGVRLYLFRTLELVEPRMVFDQLPTNSVPNQIATDPSLDRIRQVVEMQEKLIFPVGGAIVVPRAGSRAVVGTQKIPLGAVAELFQPEWISGAAGSILAMIRNAFRVELEIREPVSKPRKIVLKTGDPKGTGNQKIQIQHAQWILPTHTP
jgi:hypothetical protein